MVDVQCKWFWFAWNSVPIGTYMYKEKKMDWGFTIAREQTAILCQVAMLKKIFHEESYHLPAENLYHWPYSSNFCFLCKGGLSRSHGYQAKCSLNGSKLKCSMFYYHVAGLKI